MTTYAEMQKGTKNKKRLRFLKGLRRRKKTGSSGKEFWQWIPGYEGLYKRSTKDRVRIVVPTKRLIQEPQRILSGAEARKFLKELGVKNDQG